MGATSKRYVFVDGDDRVGAQRVVAAQVPEDGEVALLVGRVAALHRDHEILAAIAVEIRGRDGERLAVEAERGDVEVRISERRRRDQEHQERGRFRKSHDAQTTSPATALLGHPRRITYASQTLPAPSAMPAMQSGTQ